MDRHAHGKKKLTLTGQERAIVKSRRRKVAKHKLYSEYKKALKDAPLPPPGEGPSGGGQRWRAPKVPAAEAARRKWKGEQGGAAAERAAAQAEAEERQRAIEAAQQRRSAQSKKLNKKTRRGQPVLSNQMDRMLAQIQRS